jgi:glycosyltransferase involved in cell wall biosynthesis
VGEACGVKGRTCIYYIEVLGDRWFKGDHKWRAPLRRLIRGPDPIGGVKRVFVNLCLGLDRLGHPYEVNLPFAELRPEDRVGIIGRGVECLEGYRQPNPILAGVAVAAHPAECPDLFERFPVARYVVHCEWVKAMYERHYGPRIDLWAVGIDTETWRPGAEQQKSVDFLVYDKVIWERDRVHAAMVEPILAVLRRRGLSFEVIRYGRYKPEDYAAALARARAMLFLCEHETQGLAYQEALSSGVPVLAWDPGLWLDPWRFRYGETVVPATSVPFFDERCGRTFTGYPDFEERLDEFLEALKGGELAPRDYILENLTLEKCARNYLSLLESIAR